MMLKILTDVAPLVPLVVVGTGTMPADGGANDNAVMLWLAGVAGVSIIFNQLAQVYKTLTSGLKEQPPPSQTYATKTDCTSKHSHVDKRFDDIAIRFNSSDAKAEARVTSLHSRINEVLAAVSELKGRINK